jgi:hypothetical protein
MIICIHFYLAVRRSIHVLLSQSPVSYSNINDILITTIKIMCIKLIKLKHYKIAGMSQINYDKKLRKKR